MNRRAREQRGQGAYWQVPLVQLLESHCVLYVHLLPRLLPRQHPSVQLLELHCVLYVQRSPMALPRQYPPVQLLVPHCVLYVHATPRLSLQLPLLTVQLESRAASRVHIDGSCVELAAWLSQFMWQVKSVTLHPSWHAMTSKPAHAWKACAVPQA
jgi:hypothetical protein